MQANNIPEGTIGVWDMQRQSFVALPPEELNADQELWIVKDSRWQPNREITDRENRDVQIALHAQAIIELTGFDDD